MKTAKSIPQFLNCLPAAALAGLLLAGCQTAPDKSASPPASAMSSPAPAPAPVPAVAPAAAPAMVAEPAPKVIRIEAGADGTFTDSSGNMWLADQGFADGETDQRPEVTITGTTDQHIYQAEHYSMTKFTQPMANGHYLVKLHFCETYDGITGPGQRVFSFNVAGHEFKDFDVWVKAGGPLRPYIETVPVEITGGQLEITFTPNVENPEINGIEILPGS